MLEQELAADSTISGEPRRPRGPSGSWTERMAVADEWERQHEAEWVRIDQKLRGLAARRAALDAEEARLLRYAEERAPRKARKGDREVDWKQLCCIRDEGRPLGLGLQDQGSNYRLLPRSNGRGGERDRKRRDQPVRCAP